MKKIGVIGVFVLFLMFLVSLASAAELVAYYEFDGDYRDTMNNYDGSLYAGKATFSSDNFAEGYGTSLEFVGNDFMRARNFDALDDYSIALWVKTSYSGLQGVIELAGPTEANTRKGLLYKNNYIASIWGASRHFQYTENIGIADGEWHYLVNTYDGEKSRVYVDGTELAPIGAVRKGSSRSIVSTLRVGGASTSPAYAFRGQIDEVKIWDGALSELDVGFFYNNYINPVSDDDSVVGPVVGPDPDLPTTGSNATSVILTFSCLGDANNDGVVTSDDYDAVQANFGNACPSDNWCLGDANNDGIVSAGDSALVQSNIGNVCDDSDETVTELTIENIFPFGDYEVSSLPAEVKISLDTSDDAICSYSLGNSTSMIDFFYTGSMGHSQKLNLNSGEYTFNIKCEDSSGNIASDSISFEVIFREGVQLENCSGMKEFIQEPYSIQFGGREWILDWNSSWEYGDGSKVYSASFSQQEDYRSGYVSVELTEFVNIETLEERFDYYLEDGLCEQEKIYASDDYSQEGDYEVVYLCKNIWNRAYNNRNIDSGNDGPNDVTAFWITGNSLFEIRSSDYYYDSCYSYEDCRDREEERHRNQQQGITNFLEKLISNREKHVGGFYLPWESRGFANLFLTSCGSDVVVEEGYIGSWFCKSEPVLCPPHGSQKEICTRWNSQLDKEEKREAETSCSPGICSGCYVPRWFGDSGSNNVCIPYGTRFEHQTNWGIEEVFVEDSDKESLTVTEAEQLGNEVGLEVYSDGTALLTLETGANTYANISLVEGNEYDWDQITGETYNNLQSTLYVDEIYYNSVDYGESYIKVTFTVSGKQKSGVAETFNAYCNYDGRIMTQKGVLADGSWANCQNNYECESNLCSSGECIEITSLIESVSGMKSLGVRVLCRLADLFGVENYEQCIFDSLGEDA